MPNMIIMHEVEFDERYVSDDGSRVLMRVYGRTIVDEDGDDVEADGEWVLYMAENGVPQEAWAVNTFRNNIADRHGLMLIDRKR